MNKKDIHEIKKLRSSKRFSITLAESCTGGLLSSYLTSIDGSSLFFNGSIVSYSNTLKEQLLNVPSKVIKRYGAVSNETAMAMVKGLKKKSKSEILISITGVAGPMGGTKRTPVGCVYFGIGTKKKNIYKFRTIRKIFRENSRKKIQQKSVNYAVKTILTEIKKI